MKEENYEGKGIRKVLIESLELPDPLPPTLHDRDPREDDLRDNVDRFILGHTWINKKDDGVFILEGLHKGKAKWKAIHDQEGKEK